MKVLMVCAAIMSLVSLTQARDCRISKEFEIKQSQVLAGILEDPSGAIIPGAELQLLSEDTVVRKVTTTNKGLYDFGEVSVGKYRVRIQHEVFCAPKVRCRRGECSLRRQVEFNPKVKWIEVESSVR